MSQKVLESIARKLGKDGIKYVEENNELPPVKLTDEEIEFLKGGAGPYQTLRDYCKKLTDIKEAILGAS